MKKILFIILILCLSNIAQADELKSFHTSFESVDEFKGFYIVPRNHKNTSSHSLSSDVVYSGTLSHKAWAYKENSPSTRFKNNNHRAYPTVQLHKLPTGSFKTPCEITLMVWLDTELSKGEWFSFMTLSADSSDKWSRVVCVNLSDKGFVHLMHVPRHGQGKRIFQTNSIKFPLRKWVELKVLIDFDRNNGYAKVWQDGELVSHAYIKGGKGFLEQAHFGLYAPPSVKECIVYNDDLTIQEIAD